MQFYNEFTVNIAVLHRSPESFPVDEPVMTGHSESCNEIFESREQIHMGVSITFTSDASNTELDAVNALITVLRNRNDYLLPNGNEHSTLVEANQNSAFVQQVTVAEVTSADPNGGPASSSENGAALQAGTSATVPAAPVAIPPAPTGEVPVPLSVPPAPVAVAPPPPASSGAVSASPAGVELDAEGLPWDARIHSGNREKIAKGTWRRRKNTPDETWDAVRAELRQVMAVPAPTPSVVPDAAAAFGAPVPPTPPAVVPAPPAPPPAPPAQQVAAPVATASPEPAATAVADGDPVMTLLVRITGDQAAGTLTVDQVQAAAVAAGLTSIRDLMKRPDLVPVISAALFGA